MEIVFVGMIAPLFLRECLMGTESPVLRVRCSRAKNDMVEKAVGGCYGCQAEILSPSFKFCISASVKKGRRTFPDILLGEMHFNQECEEY